MRRRMARDWDIVLPLALLGFMLLTRRVFAAALARAASCRCW